MIYTQRKLESLLKIYGKVVLPYRARLSPLAQDWVKAKKIAIGYSDDQSNSENAVGAITTGALTTGALTTGALTTGAIALGQASAVGFSGTAVTGNRGGFVWWCDGPCGPSKAALMSLEREVNLKPMDIAQQESSTVDAIKKIATSIKTNQISGAIVLVKTGAVAGVFANRCPSIRAITGTCIDAVDQGMRLVGANVLIIEHPYKSLSQTKTLATRFVKSTWTLSDDVKQQLQEMSSCA